VAANPIPHLSGGYLAELKTAFAFIGLNAEAIVAEGIAVGPDQRAAAVEAAQAQIAALRA
jgi:FMN-dependent NADH-azoreductase